MVPTSRNQRRKGHERQQQPLDSPTGIDNPSPACPYPVHHRPTIGYWTVDPFSRGSPISSVCGTTG